MTTSAGADRQQRRSWLDLIALGALVAALGLAFFTPAEVTQGNVARLYYVHVPTILAAYICFALTLIGGVGYLITRRFGWDHLAVAAAEVGVLYTAFTIVMGMFWAKPTWGVYWTWSARLTLTAIMLFVYIGYLALRRVIDEPTARARRAAVYGILSIAIVPVVHMSVTWWRDIHQPPTMLRPDAMQIDGVLFAAFMGGMVAYSLVAAALIRRRYRLSELELAADLAVRSSNVVAGDAVAAPKLEGTS